MHRAAARLIAVSQSRQRLSAAIGIGPPGDRLALDIGAQILALEKARLVVRSEPRLSAVTPLQTSDLNARLAELGCKNAAGGTNADNDDIGFLDRHGSSPPLQTDDRLAGKGLRALQIFRGEQRLPAGEAD